MACPRGILQRLTVLRPIHRMTPPAVETRGLGTRLPGGVRRALIWAGFLAGAVLYWHGATLQADVVNVNQSRTDQKAYMKEAKAYHADPFGYVSHRNRMPVYLLLQSLVYRTGMSDAEFFARGKRFNIVLSMVLLVLLYLTLRRALSWLPATVLFAVTAFTIWIFKAGFFQAELLFYALICWAFLLMVRVLARPTWRWGLAAGGVSALAHLTKASILPGFALFLAAGAAWAFSLLARSGGDRARARAYLLALAAAAGSFALVISPYAVTSKRVFGRYLYNVNSTFYMWYDSYDEAARGTLAHGDAVGWPRMPPEEIPSARRYFATHTPHQVAWRIRSGFRRIMRNCTRYGYGYAKYAIALLLFVGVAVAWNHRAAREALAGHALAVGFAVVYLGTYLVLYSFYAPISAGTRLILAQWLPFTVSLAAAVDRTPIREWSVRIRDARLRLWPVFNVVLACLLLAELPDILGRRLATVYGGY